MTPPSPVRISAAHASPRPAAVDPGVARAGAPGVNTTVNAAINTRGNGWRLRCVVAVVVALVGAAVGARAADPAGAYAHAFVAADGSPLPLAPYAGRPILVVNTGIYCDSPGQHDALQALWERYRDRGLVVLAVPSDDFRTPHAAAGKTFCVMNLGLDYPMTTKVHVAGPEAHAFFRWAAAAVHEDYTKILVAPDGSVARVFPAAVEPLDPGLLRAVEAGLAPGS